MNWQYFAIAGAGLLGGAVIGVYLFPTAVQSIASSLTTVVNTGITWLSTSFAEDPVKTFTVIGGVATVMIPIVNMLYKKAKANMEKAHIVEVNALGEKLSTTLSEKQSLLQENELLRIENNQLTALPSDVKALQHQVSTLQETLTQKNVEVQTLIRASSEKESAYKNIITALKTAEKTVVA